MSLFACGGNGREMPRPEIKRTPMSGFQVPGFNTDSAYYFIQRQVDFGPRVPNTNEHKECAEWLHKKLSEYADTALIQFAEVEAFDGTKLEIKNIIGSFNPNAGHRLLLCAHWDTRPFADQEEDPDLMMKPIPGANDGGSGVGVLLEIARILKENPVDFGIDIIFFDAEDYGLPSWKRQANSEKTWCLGSQYWSRNPHKPNYTASKGILLDMVGAKDATFTLEQFSMTYNPNLMNRVWENASHLGFDNYFIRQRTGPVIDDHYFINTIAGIPTINIIQRDLSTRSGFGTYWHTHADNMDIIDRSTLDAVGSTVIFTIFQENKQFNE
ncbi:MAG: M28 family peptidase [Chitinophagaceae bacterium]|nr:MAG: M28 family peptidase [Chitinophagaceae bacterium]